MMYTIRPLRRKNRNDLELPIVVRNAVILRVLLQRQSVDFENDIGYKILNLALWGGQMDYRNEQSSLAKAHGGMIETKVAIAHGISDRTPFAHTITTEISKKRGARQIA